MKDKYLSYFANGLAIGIVCMIFVTFGACFGLGFHFAMLFLV